jgi:hypothetical protein
MNVWGTMKKMTLGGLVAGALVFVSSFSVTGCLTKDDNNDTTKTDTTHHTALGTETTIDAGAQGATLGSVLDLDAGKALSSAQANAAQATIDLVFMFYGGAFHVDNAVAAKAAGVANNINLTNTYDATKIKDIEIVKVSTKPADQEAAKAAFAAGTKIKGSVITGGEMFLVMTTESKLALVTVGTIVGTDNKANASFKVVLNSIP